MFGLSVWEIAIIAGSLAIVVAVVAIVVASQKQED
jgi:hypothetical protein